MNLEAAAKLAQKCTQGNPVIVLGSGASIPHGIGSMSGLADYLRKNIFLDGEEEEDAWLLIRTSLNAGDGLEDALLSNKAPDSLVTKIINLTWAFIAGADLDLMRRAASGDEIFPLSQLLTSLTDSTHKTINVVTTNYDRVCEYAADQAGLFHLTGFNPGIISSREGSERISIWRGNQQARTVRIWKVHGSLDWFMDDQGIAKSLPLSDELIDGFSPLIVTPGVSKFERTYDEPFRTAIQGADTVLQNANAFICIGYGFRDSHIQPKLLERCKQRNVPIVVLARTLTDEAKDFLRTSAGDNFIAFERNGNATRVYTSTCPDGASIAGQELWSFPSFNSLVT